MKKLYAFTGCLAMAATIQAQAAVLTYDFSATIYLISEYGGPFGSRSALLSETEGPGSGAAVKVGQHIAGKFSFDNAAVPVNVYYGPYGLVISQYAGNMSASYSILENGTGSSGSAIYTQFVNPSSTYADHLSISGRDNGFDLDFFDQSHSLFANGLPTTTLSLNNLSSAAMNAFWRRTDGMSVGFHANMTNLTPSVAASDVPEPASWGLLLAGFGALCAAARRRRHG